MIIFKKEKELRQYLSAEKHNGKVIGFVPTMGALHAGHCSLIEKARLETNIVVCSIFVNPTQFNDKSDYDKYPITIDADVAMLIEAGCDVLFLPSVKEIYPDGTEAAQAYDFGYLNTVLEGAQRPGHFKGVGQVVARLLQMVVPDKLFLGQKDFQQCMVIKKLLELMDKPSAIDVVICPTLREADGLAMSSRNVRLTEPQRALAGIIYQCLVSIQTKAATGNFELVQKECIDLLTKKGFEPEYVALANANDLQIMQQYDSNIKMVALIAAKIGAVRLIDNMLLN